MYGGYSILLPLHGKQDEYDGVQRTQMLLVVHLIDHQGCSPLLHTGQGRDIPFGRCPISFRMTFLVCSRNNKMNIIYDVQNLQLLQQGVLLRTVTFLVFNTALVA